MNCVIESLTFFTAQSEDNLLLIAGHDGLANAPDDERFKQTVSFSFNEVSRMLSIAQPDKKFTTLLYENYDSAALEVFRKCDCVVYDFGNRHCFAKLNGEVLDVSQSLRPIMLSVYSIKNSPLFAIIVDNTKGVLNNVKVEAVC